MRAKRSPIGCLRGCLVMAFVVVGVAVAATAWIAWRMGGLAGFQREVLVKGTLSGMETQVLKQRPDGVSESEIQVAFDRVRTAVSEERADLDQLYRAIRDYQRAFQDRRNRPSDGEMRAFLSALEAAVLPISQPQESPAR